jgi:glycosyltransferase involved in cell wall biosynthesis
MSYPSLSVILPAFNEAKNLPATVKALSHRLRQLQIEYEIIVVDDGSTDETNNVCRQLSEAEPDLGIVLHENNCGYGAALRSGFLAATHEFVYLTDADGQFDLEHLPAFLEKASTADAVIGYRRTRADAQHRIVLSRLGNWLAGNKFNLAVRDINCAAKLLRRSRLALLRLHSSGAMISTELLYRAREDGWKIVELPVRHFPRKFGRASGARAGVIARTVVEFFKLATAKAQRLPRHDLSATTLPRDQTA